ncbi:transcriptional regulator, TetR family [Collimonas sp. OK607]|uniref:TetR/AcrR family transcriptional regulator n=1 Tax=Collimonas sp. OK607 TaxID=1798194 RepID=UPI0008F3AF90|nr:TetR family transcriptional regulator [Collimonas sp. OK607]SFB27704.1 transcriptional regulator, TetR family [Collimonas sp. OK607]
MTTKKNSQISDPTTRERILRSAKHLFAQDGLDARVADIVEDAGANIAAINYHFGSKENLLREVLEIACGQVHDERLLLLNSVTEGGRVATVREIIESWVVPALRKVFASDDEGPFLAQLTRIVTTLDTNKKIGESVARQLDECNGAFLDALEKSRPDLTRASLVWRLFGMIGVLVFISGNNLRGMEELSRGASHPRNFDEAMREILPFLVAGFEAPAPPK